VVAGHRTDDDVGVLGVSVEERLEVDLQCPGQWHEDVEADGALARFDSADGRRAEVAPVGEHVE
jgi:hypothetical protein